MKKSCAPFTRRPGGFTLIELLVVISIIAVLASMLLPALATAKTKAQVAKAKTEISNIAAAIGQYQADYSRFPAGPATRNALDPENNPDFTFGTFYRSESGGQQVLADKKGRPLPQIGNSKTKANYQTSNAEVMAILLGWEKYPNGQFTVNKKDPQNPKGTAFLNAKMVSDARSGGIGPDGVNRDPWGDPYIITLDLNYDNKCLDGFYRQQSVSLESGDKGFNGLYRSKPGDNFEARLPVMVWSLGPDGKADAVPANKGANKDNVLNWK